MPDILKVTTPIINKNQPVAPKTAIDPLNPFTISDPTRVMRAHNQSELLQQNTNLGDNSEAPVLLMNLLKDPMVTVTYLKNIFMLEEIFKLLPQNNSTVTGEIEQLCQTLIMNPEDVKKELLRQEDASTRFRGEIFSFLRELSASPKSTPNMQVAIANFLKSINNVAAKDDVIDSVANGLEFLKENLQPSTGIFAKLEALVAKFRQGDSHQQFYSLKEEVLTVLKDVEQSLLYTPKLSKVASMIVYNLSRYNSSMQFFNEAAFRLRQMLSPTDQREFVRLVTSFSKLLQSGEFTFKNQAAASDKSIVMDSLIKLVQTQSLSEGVNLSEGAKVDNILHSLLSSPCNFTPLLHFVVPVIENDVKAFAEIWINPESDEKDMPDGVSTGKHFLLVIDIENIGRFEAEIFSHDRIIDFFLFCPPGFEEDFSQVIKDLPVVLKQLDYTVGQTKIEPLNTGRSLMQVFKSLPYKRVGVDVKI